MMVDGLVEKILKTRGIFSREVNHIVIMPKVVDLYHALPDLHENEMKRMLGIFQSYLLFHWIFFVLKH